MFCVRKMNNEKLINSGKLLINNVFFALAKPKVGSAQPFSSSIVKIQSTGLRADWLRLFKQQFP